MYHRYKCVLTIRYNCVYKSWCASLQDLALLALRLHTERYGTGQGSQELVPIMASVMQINHNVSKGRRSEAILSIPKRASATHWRSGSCVGKEVYEWS
jgi:hypothetical protein